MKELGIKKDYTLLTLLAFVLGDACTFCVTLSAFRLYKIKTSPQLTLSSTMDIMTSPSERGRREEGRQDWWEEHEEGQVSGSR